MKSDSISFFLYVRLPRTRVTIRQHSTARGRGEGVVLPYIDYTGMCRWRGYGFQAIWSDKGYGFQAIWFGKVYGFQAIWSGKGPWGLVIIENWSSIGSCLTGSLTKD